MSGKRMDYRRINRETKRASHNAQTDGITMASMLRANDAALYVALAKSLLLSPHITDAQRTHCEKYLTWTGGSGLSRNEQERLRRIERYVIMAEAGRLPPQTSAEKASAMRECARKYHLSVAASVDRQATNPRPDWMSDPSKLPKRPPQRAAS